MKELVVIIVLSGWASQYSPGVMQKVVPNQQRYGHLPGALPKVDGYVAVVECSRLGDILYLRQEGETEWERFLVADCQAPEHRANPLYSLEANGILLEVDYLTAVRWNTVGRGKRVEMGKRVWQYVLE